MAKWPRNRQDVAVALAKKSKAKYWQLADRSAVELLLRLSQYFKTQATPYLLTYLLTGAEAQTMCTKVHCKDTSSSSTFSLCIVGCTRPWPRHATALWPRPWPQCRGHCRGHGHSAVALASAMSAKAKAMATVPWPWPQCRGLGLGNECQGQGHGHSAVASALIAEAQWPTPWPRQGGHGHGVGTHC